jgi:hypothetical protein
MGGTERAALFFGHSSANNYSAFSRDSRVIRIAARLA